MKYVASRNLVILPRDLDRYTVRRSLSDAYRCVLDGTALAVLSAFVRPRDLEEAAVVLGELLELSPSELASVVERLLEEGILLPAEGPPAARPSWGYASPESHRRMLADTRRTEVYRAAIERHAPGRRVVELGCGSGVLSMMAARAGASSVVGIEETAIIEVARSLVQRNGLEGRVRLVAGNSLDVTLDEPGEVLVHELIGDDPFAEHALRYLRDARSRLLVPGGKLLPGTLEIACVGMRLGGEAPERAREALSELGGAWGLDLEPLVAAHRDRPAGLTFAHDLGVGAAGVLTDEAVLHVVELGADDSERHLQPVERSLRARADATLDALVLFFRLRFDPDLVLSTAPDQPKTHWPWLVRQLEHPVAVAAGDELRVRAEITSHDGHDRYDLRLAC